MVVVTSSTVDVVTSLRVEVAAPVVEVSAVAPVVVEAVEGIVVGSRNAHTMKIRENYTKRYFLLNFTQFCLKIPLSVFYERSINQSKFKYYI